MVCTATAELASGQYREMRKLACHKQSACLSPFSQLLADFQSVKAVTSDPSGNSRSQPSSPAKRGKTHRELRELNPLPRLHALQLQSSGAKAQARRPDRSRWHRRSTEKPGNGIRRNLLFGRSEEHTSELQSLRHLVCR